MSFIAVLKCFARHRVFDTKTRIIFLKDQLPGWLTGGVSDVALYHSDQCVGNDHS